MGKVVLWKSTNLFQGKRKYNRERLLCSDQRTGNEENEEPLNNQHKKMELINEIMVHGYKDRGSMLAPQ